MAWRVAAGTALLHWNVLVLVDDDDDDDRVQPFLLCIGLTTDKLTQGFHDGSSLTVHYLRDNLYSFYLVKTLYLSSSKYLSRSITRAALVEGKFHFVTGMKTRGGGGEV